MNIKDLVIAVNEFLRGKKSYIVGSLGIILGLYYGDKEMVLTGFGILTLRAGISKVNE